MRKLVKVLALPKSIGINFGEIFAFISIVIFMAVAFYIVF